ncbi:hypothetical protein EJ08DRAFT_703342 [Tothia fuscella]|uniref:Uncharacterized protein n=1 Tax=Tothia fuscella TaxID=1048955 RepID=A0A9P4TSW1_9PEZI|nr:hypothetical protein EJ08DRAFT_703342 [Tothia fuscella]
MYLFSSGKSKDKGPPEAYRLHRHPVDGPGYHERRHSSVERHLNTAPPIRVGYLGKRYPHQYRHTEEIFPQGRDYYEFPTSNYPYDRQIARGKVQGQPEIEGFTRTVTDHDRNIRGVMYHPENDRKKFVRADEVYPSRSRRRR